MSKIEPTYVTREQSKWLKEKEFDLPTYAYYSGLNFYTGEYKNHSQTTIGDTPMHKMLIGYTSAPEQHQVVEWLRVKYGIWITIGVGNLFHPDKFYILIKKYNIDRWELIHLDNEKHSPYDTPQEAYSAAFDYILKKFI
jgi:hypothetical protein